MPTEQTIRIPVYTYGKYRAQDGTYEEFDDAKMRALVKNTNFVIRQKAFVPAMGYVGYDHPVFGKVTDTDAHGHIVGAVYEDGVVSLDVKPVADSTGRMRLIEDAKAGRRPHVSGEHHNAFSFVDAHGKTVPVGPTILGLAALGSERPALKNPKIVPLSEIEFPESVSAADAFMARETLRKSGMVAQTFSEGVLVFSEIQLPSIEDETPKEQPMTPEDKALMETMLANQATTLKAAFDAQIATVKTEAANAIKAMSEGEAAKQKTLGKVALIVTEKKLSKISAAKLEEAALNPTVESVLAFGETLSAIVLPGGTARNGEGGDTDETDGDEPPALEKLRVKHFSDRDRYQSEIAAGLEALEARKPKMFSEASKLSGVAALEARIDALKTYITDRDTATN